ncbi:MAG: YfhO family protein, partial [Proteobacteria bacterium]|nr:YfhO family protein [Pseudomonadota bacterium]
VLKNLGVEPFVSIGRLPLFDRVWSLRWAGPVLIFSVSMAAAFSFEVLSSVLAKMVTNVTDGSVAKRVRYLRSYTRPGTVLFSICALLVLSYTVLVLFPAIELATGAEQIFNARMAPFVTPSVLYSTLFTLCVIITGALLFILKGRDAKARYSLVAGVAALTVLELWWAVPRGWGAQWLGVKWIPAAVGLVAVVLFFIRYFKTAAALTLLFTALFLYLDSASVRGLPERQDPFQPAPYVEFIKERAPGARTLGTYGTLFPNSASALKLYDVHYVNSLVASEYHDFRYAYLHAELFKEGPNSELWFSGRPERSVEREAALGPGAIYNKISRPVENDIAYRLKSYSLLGVKYIVLPADKSLTKGGFSRFVNRDKGPLFRVVYDKEVRIYENPYALNRAYVVHSTVKAESYEEAQRKANSKDFDIRSTAVVETELNFLPPLSEAALGIEQTKGMGQTSRATATITEYGMNFVRIEAESEEPGLLVLTDTYYPGWRVSVNGTDAKVKRVNGLVRGVEIGTGNSTVIFRYCPLSFSLGLLLFALSALLCVLLYMAAHRREKRTEESGNP